MPRRQRSFFSGTLMAPLVMCQSGGSSGLNSVGCALERILRGHTGALIVLGMDKTIESMCTGGFSLDVEFSATRLRERDDDQREGADRNVDVEAQRQEASVIQPPISGPAIIDTGLVRTSDNRRPGRGTR